MGIREELAVDLLENEFSDNYRPSPKRLKSFSGWMVAEAAQQLGRVPNDISEIYEELADWFYEAFNDTFLD